jgi:hypothetical protein
MLTFRIYEETDNDGVFTRAKSVLARDANEALKAFVANGTHYLAPKEGERFIVTDTRDTVCYLFKLVAPLQTLDVVSA